MRYQSQPVTMWFDRRIVYRKSPIHGTGTFAIGDIQAGETLIYVTGGLVFSEDDVQAGKVSLEGSLYNEEKLPGGQRILTPVSYHYFINHACEPNIAEPARHPACTHYVALRDIRAGEELTADYYDETTLEMCNCGSPNCRWKGRGG